MILITGATGQLGKATIDSLLKKIPASGIAALARDEHKAAELRSKGIDVRIGDYTNKDSLLAAFNGVEKVLLISASEVTERIQQHINAIDAAKKAGVTHLIFTSVDMKDMSNSAISFLSQSYMQTDTYLKESGLTYTILHNTLYSDMIPIYIGEKALETGVFFPAGEGKVPFATRSDMGEAAAVVLTTNGHENKEYILSADTTYSFGDVATMLSELSGNSVRYIDPPKDVYVEQLTSMGVPEMYITFFAAFAEAIKRDEFNTGRSDMEQLLGRKPTPLKEYLQSVYFSTTSTI